MKRISRSLLSLCLALVLCAALLPVNVAKATGGGTTARTGTSFLITGYRASRSSIYTGDTVDITVYLSRTDGSNDSIRVVRGLDSFQDGTASAVASRQNGEYTVTFTGLTYTGDSGKQLAFTIYYEGNGGGYQDGNTVPVRECVPYTEPTPAPAPKPEKQPEKQTDMPERDQYKKILDELRRVNDAIPDEEMSDKISRLEAVSAKIFEQAKSDPDKLPQMRKFMDYYLPTSLKLLNTYAELDNQGVEGENISESKRRIEQTMDTLVKAFENQLDRLFASDALDVSTDIDVMQNMLRADGLTDDTPFKL